MDICIDDGWLYGGLGEWMDGWLWKDEWIDVWMDGQTDGLLGGWTNI